MNSKQRWMTSLALGLGCSLAWACAEEVPIEVKPGDRAGAAGLGAGGFLVDDDLGGAGGTAGAGSGVGGDSCGPPVDATTCGGDVFEGKSVPLDIYIMFDQSASMCACLDAGAGQLCIGSECNRT